MADILSQLLDYLQANQTDPWTYLLMFFLFSVAAAIILPVPIEIGLIWNPGMFFPLKALDLGLGKAVGSIAVFFIPSLPSRLRTAARRLAKWGPVRRSREDLRSAVRNTGIGNSWFYKMVAGLADKVMKVVDSRHRHLETPAAPAPPRWGWLRWLSRKSEGFTRKYGVIAMYVIMSIPGMIDTVPLYVFAIINKERTLIRLRDFALANFLAGINRAFIIFALLEILGIRLF